MHQWSSYLFGDPFRKAADAARLNNSQIVFLARELIRSRVVCALGFD
jgi:hypothetical protein